MQSAELDAKLASLIEPLTAEREQLASEVERLREQIAIRTSGISRIDRIIKAATPPEQKVRKTTTKGKENGEWRPSVSDERVRSVMLGLQGFGPITTGDLSKSMDGVSPDQVSKAIRVGRLDGYVRLAGHSQKRGAPELWALTDRGEAFVSEKEPHDS